MSGVEGVRTKLVPDLAANVTLSKDIGSETLYRTEVYFGRVRLTRDQRRRSSHHVAQPHGAVAGVVLHQRMVVRGEEGAAADALGQLLDDGAGDGRAVVGGRAPACERVHRGAVTAGLRR